MPERCQAPKPEKTLPGDGMKFSLEMVNTKGLHARASAKFVEVVERFGSRVTVRKDGIEVPGDSIMGLMSLGASWGSHIEVEIEGDDSEEVADEIKSLVANRFGEPS